MSEFELSEKAKEEFLNLRHIKKNLIECWFDGQNLVIPSGQGKVVKGIVLTSLEVFKYQQAKIDELQKRIDTARKILVEAESYQYEENIDIAVRVLEGESK